MEYTISFDESMSIFFIETSGMITLEEDKACIGELVKHPRWRFGCPLIIDRRNSSTEQLGPGGIRRMAEMVKDVGDKLGPVRIAVIVGTPLDYGIGRMFQTLTMGHVSFSIKICRTMVEAKQWVCPRREAIVKMRMKGDTRGLKQI